MISCDFAPNEAWDDALVSLKLLFQPWRWRRGKEIKEAKKKLLQKFQFPISPKVEQVHFRAGNSQKNFQYPITDNQYHVSFFLTGRTALYHLLQSLNLSANDEVIVQGFTCEAVILPILANNLTPVYVDIESQTFSLDPIELQKKITGKTKVVVLQHTFGLMPVNRTKVLSIIRRSKLVLIEDIAHGYNETLIGSLKRDKIENHSLLVSFGRSKALSSVFGGAIITNRTDIASKLKEVEERLSFPSILFILRLLVYKPLSVFIKNTYEIGVGKLVHKTIQTLKLLIPEITQKEKDGYYDFLLDKAYPNGLAVLLLHQLSKYEQIQKNRALICGLYRKNLKSKIKNPNKFQILNSALLRYPILAENRDEVLRQAVKHKIFLGNWYNQVVAPKSVYLVKMKYKKGVCPTAEELCKKIINLPTNISRSEALKVVGLIKAWNSNLD